jgi:hypothetical protein
LSFELFAAKKAIKHIPAGAFAALAAHSYLLKAAYQVAENSQAFLK